MRDLKHLQYFEDLLQVANNALITQAREEGKVCVAYTCENVPEPLLNLDRAFSIRLHAPHTGSMDIATYYMTNLLCEPSRALLERAIEGGFNFADCVITPDGCTMMNRAVENMELLKTMGKDNPNFFHEYMEIAFKNTDNDVNLAVLQCKNHILTPLHEKYGIDMVWIGARTTANPFLVQEIADALQDTDIPVLVKNPVNPDLDLWIGALERLGRAGLRKLGVIHRGFSTTECQPYRNAPGWQLAVELRTRYPDLPFFADPSHMGGAREHLLPLSQRAMDLGLEGLMVESHCDPSCALSDAGQQILPEDLKVLLESLTVRRKDTDDKEYNENIEQLRARIDVIDENLLDVLRSRMEVSRKIGQFKKSHNIAIVQASRWDSLLAGMIRRGAEYGLPESFVTAVFTAIHEASVDAQNKILGGG